MKTYGGNGGVVPVILDLALTNLYVGKGFLNPVD
jgi:hypothetical protein